MSRATNNIPDSLRGLNDALILQKEKPSFENSLLVANQIARLFGVESDTEPKPFNDSRGKIKDHAGWFMEAVGFADRRACYKLADTNSKNIDLKLYWVQKSSKRVISTLVALTPNFEDEPFYQKESVGVDFIIPKEANRIIIAISSNYTIRTIELEGSLTITQQEIFIKWAQDFDFENKTQLHQILWQSFDLQPLNKRFYQEVTRNFTELVQHLVGEKVFADHKHAALFTNRLIGRLIFCWFLRKKGIIADNHEYFTTNNQKSTDYYKAKLEKLFFGILNTPIEDRAKFSTDHINLFGVVKGEPNLFTTDTETPFLNGGLFEPRPTDHFGENKITFPNDYFDRFFEFLNHYNFTTDESTSSFQQVAIDPEMLGRIFENLLAEQTEDTGEQARKAKGAFYTPREIVDYMCRESMRAYIAGKLPDDEKKEYILELLFDKKEHEFDNRNHRADLVLYKKQIIEALDEVKVLDPACGSGAFPMGILQLILGLYERLETRFDPYKTKLSIIQNNLYGIDIEPMAVEIARLRVWLSILVDEGLNPKAKNMGVDPLPNLDFKFVCANSLIDLDQSGIVTLYGDDPDLENKLQTIRDAYFNTESVNKKKKLRSDYDKIVDAGEGLFGESEKARQLKTYRPFNTESSASFFNSVFMFGLKKFNLLIGNPPYGAKYSVSNKKYFIDNYLSTKSIKGIQKGSTDTFTLFIERGFNFLSLNGVFNFIVPISITSSDSMTALQKILEDNCELMKIASFSVRPKPVFENAMVNTSIIFCKKTNTKNKSIQMTKMYRKSSNTSLDKIISSIKFIDAKEYKIRGRYPKISDQIEKDILEKIFSIKNTIGKLIKETDGSPLFYSAAGGRYYKVVTNYPRNSSAEKSILFDKDIVDVVGALLSSNLYFWFYQVYSDNLNLKSYEIESFPVPEILLKGKISDEIKVIYKKYLQDIEKNAHDRQTENYAHIDSFKEYKIGLSKKIIDQIDDLIGSSYGLSENEISYIKNYEIDFRGTGKDEIID